MAISNLTYICLAPHPPIMVPEVGGRETEKVRASITAMNKVGRCLAASKAETVILISPHAPIFRDAVVLNTSEHLEGDLGNFGAPQVSFNYVNDLELTGKIAQVASGHGFDVIKLDREFSRGYGLAARLDHGAMVPLYFLRRAGWEGRLVLISMAFLPVERLYAFGSALGEAVAQLDRPAGGGNGNLQVALVVSGDLSHRLSERAPDDYDPQGQVFDRLVREKVENLDVPGLLNLPSGLVERAGQCGYRSLLMGLGAMEGRLVESRVLSYEAPFGVGYLVADFLPGEPSEKSCLLPQLLAAREARLAKMRAGESFPVRLARQSLENFVREGRMISPPAGSELPAELHQPAGTFVSLHKGGELRGCIGTTAPTRPNAAEEIIHNAVSAGTGDPRFDPVQPEELNDLEYSVDILGKPEVVSGPEDLAPEKYGVIVRSGSRSGLLLPDLEGVDTVEQQLAIAKQKAGIRPDEPCQILRFVVTRYH